MHPARLFVVCGLPGSGKTTRAIELAQRFGAVRMSADDVLARLGVDIWDEATRARVEAVQCDETERLMRIGCSVVVTPMSRKYSRYSRSVASTVGVIEAKWFMNTVAADSVTQPLGSPLASF